MSTDDKAIIATLIPLNNADMQEMINVYSREISRDLLADIKSETHGDFRHLLLSIMTAWDTYDSELIHKATSGIGTNHTLLSEVICTRSPDELKYIAKRFQGEYQKDLLAVVKSNSSGHYRDLLLMCFGEGRSGVELDRTRIAKDVDALYAAGEKKWIGTDDNTFVRIIAGQPRAHVEQVALEYGLKYGKAFSTVVGKETHGNLKYALEVLATPLPTFYADQFHKAVKGIGTDDNALIRTLCSVYHRCLRETTVQYLQSYKKNLKHVFNDETSGDYRKFLVALCDRYT